MSKNNIQCTFSCNQRWKDMPERENGRHCGVCDHVVVDFTQKTQQEIHDYLSANDNVCGIMEHDQLYPEDVSEVRLPFFKQVAAAVTTVLLSGNYASAQEPVKTEQTVANPTPIVVPEPIAVEDTSTVETPVTAPQRTPEQAEKDQKAYEKLMRKRRGRHLIGNIYARRKFPFFYRRRLIVGMHAIGGNVKF